MAPTLPAALCRMRRTRSSANMGRVWRNRRAGTSCNNKDRPAGKSSTPPASSLLPGFVAETWFGFVTTAGTPPEIISRLSSDINAILNSKEMQDKFTALGQQVKTMTPAQLGKLIAEDNARWGQVVREANISAN